MSDNDPLLPPTPPAPRSPRPRRLLTPLALGAGAVLLGAAVFAVAGAATAQGTPSQSPTASADEDDTLPFRDRRWHRLGPMGGHGPMMGGGMLGMGAGGIHAEATVPDGDGGYRTMLTQVGEVTAVSADSVSVRSDDGYRHTYAVVDDTSVNSGRDGIADVAVGDDVHLVAYVQAGTDTVAHIADLTRMRAWGERFGHGPGAMMPAPDEGSDGST